MAIAESPARVTTESPARAGAITVESPERVALANPERATEAEVTTTAMMATMVNPARAVQSLAKEAREVKEASQAARAQRAIIVGTVDTDTTVHCEQDSCNFQGLEM